MNAWLKLSVKQARLITCLSAVVAYWVIESFSGGHEIALIIGEPWDHMRYRSSARIGAAPPGAMWGFSPKTDARLRFIDPQYGFVTPLADFFIVAFDNQKVESVVIYPHTKPLLLDDALAVVLDIQKQWQSKGWFPLYPSDNPPVADSPEWRTQIRDVYKGATTYWRAGGKYDASLSIHRSNAQDPPGEERFRVELDVAKAWMRSREEHEGSELKTFAREKRCPPKLRRNCNAQSLLHDRQR